MKLTFIWSSFTFNYCVIEYFQSNNKSTVIIWSFPLYVKMNYPYVPIVTIHYINENQEVIMSLDELTRSFQSLKNRVKDIRSYL